MSTFDRSKPYTTVLGDSRATFYQGGQHYTAAGESIADEEAAKPAVGGPTEQSIEAEIARRQAPSDAELNASVKINDPGNRQNRPKDKPKPRSRASE